MQKITQLGKRHGYVILILVGIIALTFLPRVLSLDAHWSSDETTWLFRSYGFATALQRHEYAGTFQSYHPGVSTMWLGGLALWREYGSALDMAPKFMQKKFLAPRRLAHARLPVALLTGLTILVIGLLLRRLLGNAVACVGVLAAGIGIHIWNIFDAAETVKQYNERRFPAQVQQTIDGDTFLTVFLHSIPFSSLKADDFIPNRMRNSDRRPWDRWFLHYRRNR